MILALRAEMMNDSFTLLEVTLIRTLVVGAGR